MEKNVLMLIGDAHKLFKSQIRKKAEENNLNNCYLSIIRSLFHHDGLTQLELVHLTRLKAPTISLTLQKMELEGYVKRVSSEEDGRKMLVYITDKGINYHHQMQNLIKNLENQILPQLSNEEIKNLERTLSKLIDIICNEFGEFKNENI